MPQKDWPATTQLSAERLASSSKLWGLSAGMIEPIVPPSIGLKPAAAAQSPCPGAGEKCSSSLLGTPSHSLASAGGSRLIVMFGQALA
jgi:hypothetical protein